MREVRRLLKLELRLSDSCSNQVSRVESKLHLKQNPLLSIVNKGRSGLMSLAGIENRDATINSTRFSILDSRFSRGADKNFAKQLQVTRGAHNPNLQVVITHVSHVCSQHSFGLPIRMNGMHRTHSNHTRLDFLSLVIWSSIFWPSVTWNLHKAQRWSKSALTFDCCRLHSVSFGYY